ncbi:ATP-dependent Clp protease ATP-binding subunit [bacterium]|nr:MAG: ATP-dependent Clp protease ATP-binding subunit [bacterium]RIK61742.1 MAG: hypothetical protein DCC64_12520 [Planctomycetota bacterium]
MALISFRIPAFIQDLGGGLLLGEALLFPEITRLSDSRPRLTSTLGANLRRILEQEPLLDLHRRRQAARVEVRTVPVEIDAPRELPLWSGRLSLRFHALCWRQGDAEAARVPALSIEVLATGQNLETLLASNIRAALTRRGMAQSLRELAFTQRVESVTHENISVVPQLRTPREIARHDEGMAEPPSVLAEVGTDLCKVPPREAWELDESVAALARLIGGEHPCGVLLVGQAGVGKTALFHQLVRERARFALGATPFWETSGSRLVAGMSGYGMWQQRCDHLRREAAKARAVVHLGSLAELMDVGKAEGMEQGVAGFLRPFIARGELLAVVEATPEQAALIERIDPALLNAFTRLLVEEPSPQRARAILRREADFLARPAPPPARRKRIHDAPEPCSLSDDGLDKLERLHRRFASYSAWPGRPLRFLRNLLRDGTPGSTLTARDVTLAFARESGLPLSMLDEDAELKLEEAQQFFNERVLAQDRAVELVVDLLATFKAGLARPGRPLASLLFIGPTGVGKTELARSLAEYLFSDRARLTRFDMSEYADPASVQRLISGSGGEGLLTARVREQPFAVILFDEFEKADSSFFDLLLQVLGEGRLTDAQGRIADFTTSVIIMTSNLGAQGFMQGNLGFGARRKKAEAHFTAEVRNFLRPELLNRLDRIVPFMPLSAKDIERVAARELELARRRAAASGRLELHAGPGVAEVLARLGWQEKYGARPLKRAMERHLLVPLAVAVNESSAPGPLHVEVSARGDGLGLEIRAARRERGKRADPAQAALTQASLELRRSAQQLLKSPVVRDLTGEIYNLERAARQAQRRRRKGGLTAEEAVNLKRLPRCKEALGRVDSLQEDARRLEDRALLASFGRPGGSLDDALMRLRQDFDRALLGLYHLRFEQVEYGCLALHGERPALAALAQCYLGALRERGFEVTLYRYARELSRQELKRLEFDASHNAQAQRARTEYHRRVQLGAALCLPVLDEDRFFAEAPEGLPAMALEVLGENALPLIELEKGKHLLLLEQGDRPLACHVDVIEVSPMDYLLPRGEALEKLLAQDDIRRKYDLPLRKLLDLRLGRIWAWPGRDMHVALGQALTESFSHTLKAQVAS